MEKALLEQELSDLEHDVMFGNLDNQEWLFALLMIESIRKELNIEQPKLTIFGVAQ